MPKQPWEKPLEELWPDLKPPRRRLLGAVVERGGIECVVPLRMNGLTLEQYEESRMRLQADYESRRSKRGRRRKA